MAMSVGLARIINDPDASILTRKALGALSRPNLLVTDKGLTIDNDGRMVLRITPGSALSEDDDGLAVNVSAEGGLSTGDAGLAVKVVPNGGLELFADGLAVKLKDGGGLEAGFDGLSLSDFGIITVAGINVSGNAFVDGNVDVFGNIGTLGSVTCSSIISSGTLSTGSISTGAITCSSVNASGDVISSGDVIANGAAISGNANIGGVLTVGSFNPSSLSVSGNVSVGGNASISGTLTAGTFSPSNLDVSEDVTVGGNNVVDGSVGIGTTTLTERLNIFSATAQHVRLLYDASNYFIINVLSSGRTRLRSFGSSASIYIEPQDGILKLNANTELNGNAYVSGNLTVTGTINGGGSSGGGDAITPTSVRINGGTTMTRVLSFYASVAYSGSAFYQDFYFGASGVVYGDAVFCSPLGSPGNSAGAWSARAEYNQVVIRIHTVDGPSGAFLLINATFRVVVMGFA